MDALSSTTSSASATPRNRASRSTSVQAYRAVSQSSFKYDHGSKASATGRHTLLQHLDQDSGIAAGPTTNRTRLRKNLKSPSITSDLQQIPHVSPAHMRRLSGIPKTLSFPSFHSRDSQPEPQDSTSERRRPSSPHGANTPSTHLLRAQSSGSIIRSPSQKRKPPASHSSYGVETSLGPPPSYSTQRTLSQDRVWSADRSSSSTSSRTPTATERAAPHLNEVNKSQQSSQSQQPRTASSKQDLTTLPLPRNSDPDVSSPETIDTTSLATPQGSDMTPPTSAGGANTQEETETTTQGLGLDRSHDDVKALSSDETQKSEDLFLNIAKTDATLTTAKTDRRRSRISLPFFSGSKPSPGVKSSSMATQFEPQHIALRPEEPRRFSKRSSLGQHVPGALTSSQYLDDTRSRVSRAVDERSHVGSINDRSEMRSRRNSNANADTLRPPTRSYTASRGGRLVSENLYGDRIRTVEQPATESTMSTTAPSTVWDELDDLKSRIKKLELTGKLPPSSAAAMSTAERPRTATTQATTMSSSPKHKTAVSTMPSQIEGISSTVHPLLHEALSNAKSVISNEVYQKLQATAQDALLLSAMMNHEGYNGHSSMMSPVNERQIRRRTESMCRSLTELAIAMLAESRGVNSPTARPSSRDAFAQPSSGLRSRRLSNESSDRPPVTSRVQSRLESRRTSLHMAQTQSPITQPPLIAYDNPPASVISQPPTTTTRLPRTSASVRSRRIPSHVDGSNEEEDASPGMRPVSRARTDVSVAVPSFRSTRNRTVFSREYTKQHPLPTATSHIASQAADSPTISRTPLPSNVNNSLISRRNISYTSPSSNVSTPQSAQHPQQTIFHRQPADESSPITPSHTSSSHIPFQRPPFAISVERRSSTNPESPAATNTPDSNTGSAGRTASTRRSLGFASRISNVSSRLKAARAERMANTSTSRSSTKDGIEGGQGGEENQPVCAAGAPERNVNLGTVEALPVAVVAGS